MIAYIFIVGLILGASYWTLRPLLRGEGCQEDYAPEQEDIVQQLEFKKEETYSTIRDLEFDLKMGKLSEEDFQILKQQYMEEAVGYLKELDQLKSSEPIGTASNQDIDEENTGEIKSVPPRKSTAEKYIYCTSCGKKATVKDRFCVGCGSSFDRSRVTPESGLDDAGEEAEKC